MYRIKLTAQARREFKVVKSIYQEAIVATFEEMKENPFVGKLLARELVGKYSYKIGSYRIIYKINKRDRIIQVLTIGHRSTVYE